MLKNLIFCSTFILSSLAYGQFDKFNTYLWKPTSTKPWFEWWYYKVVIPETKESFYFVYGIVNPWDKTHKLAGTQSYVGMGDFSSMSQVENKFDLDEFHAKTDQTYVEMPGSIATDTNFKGNLIDKVGESYSWDISIEKDWGYNALGWAIGTNITNIKWYPAQAGAHCSGSVISKGKLYQFANAPCYQDRNWGTSFPLWWTWIVSNHFKNNPDTVLAVGGGRPKYFGTKFPLEGVSIGLKHKGIDYHFRPNDLDRVKVDINFGKWEVFAEHKNDKVVISAFAPKEKFLDIPFTSPTGEVFHDYETLTGVVTLKLYHRDSGEWKLVDTLYSDTAGIEYGEPSANTKSRMKLFSMIKHLQ